MLHFLHNLSKKKWHQKIYKYFLYISYIAFALSLFGVTILKTKYSTILNNIIKIYIAVVLIIRFNPLIHVKFDKTIAEFDREIAFSAGMLLLLSVLASNYMKTIVEMGDIPHES